MAALVGVLQVAAAVVAKVVILHLVITQKELNELYE
jgi:hypothetical protein